MERRTVVVTGAGRGVGAGIAEKFARQGDAVVVTDVDKESAAAVAGRLVDAGGSAIGVQCDVTVSDEVEEAMNRAVAEFGRLDVLVNNAGVTRDNLVFKMTDEDWDLVVATHLTGSFYCVRAAQRHMVPQRYGKIVFISSRAALGNRGQTNYSAVKAGMQGMTRSLALELGPFGINVNAVAPGHIDTAMTRATAERMKIDYERMCEITISSNAIKRVGEVTDVANAVAFLASDEASYITGQILYVAGRPTV